MIVSLCSLRSYTSAAVGIIVSIVSEVLMLARYAHIDMLISVLEDIVHVDDTAIDILMLARFAHIDVLMSVING